MDYSRAHVSLNDISNSQDKTAWQALELSRKTVTKRWFKVFFTLLLVAMVNVVAAIPFFIGFIWSIPWSYNVIANLYDALLGTHGQDPVSLEENKEA